jgi:hypothetical protein
MKKFLTVVLFVLSVNISHANCMDMKIKYEKDIMRLLADRKDMLLFIKSPSRKEYYYVCADFKREKQINHTCDFILDQSSDKSLMQYMKRILSKQLNIKEGN